MWNFILDIVPSVSSSVSFLESTLDTEERVRKSKGHMEDIYLVMRESTYCEFSMKKRDLFKRKHRVSGARVGSNTARQKETSLEQHLLIGSFPFWAPASMFESGKT